MNSRCRIPQTLRKELLNMLVFYFLPEQNIFELLRRSNGYSRRQSRGYFLYGDRSGGSSVNRIWQGADLFPEDMQSILKDQFINMC